MLSGIGSSLTSMFPEITGASTGSAASTATGTSGGGFGDVFKSALQGVDDLQGGADLQIGNLMNGAPNTDVNHVMVSVEKADVAFQLMMQVRKQDRQRIPGHREDAVLRLGRDGKFLATTTPSAEPPDTAPARRGRRGSAADRGGAGGDGEELWRARIQAVDDGA